MQEQDHHCFGDRFTLLAAPPKVQEEMREMVECTVQCPTDDHVRRAHPSSIYFSHLLQTPNYSPYLGPYSPVADSPGLSQVRAHI